MVNAAQSTHPRWSIVTTGLSVIAAASLMLTPPAVLAQEVMSLSGLTLRDTYMKTGMPTSYVEGQYPYAVDPIVIMCPGPNRHSTCAVEVQLETLFSNVSQGGVAGAAITFTDKTGQESAAGIGPVNAIGMDSTSHDGMSNTRGATWWKAGVSRGLHQIRSYLTVSDGDGDLAEAGSFTRTLTVRVYTK